jgi:hypothetical protein
MLEIPTIDAHGFLLHERLPINPTSQLRAIRAADDELEDGAASFVADLDRWLPALCAP